MNAVPETGVSMISGVLRFYSLTDVRRYLKELLDVSPNHLSLYLTLGQCYRLSGKYNEALQTYNTTLQLFPNNIVAAMSGFSRNDAYFKTEPGAEKAPKVQF